MFKNELFTYLQCTHARKSELLDVILHVLVPSLPVLPWCAVAYEGIPAEIIRAIISRTLVHTVDPQSTVVDRVAELARNRDTELLAALVHERTPSVASASGPDANRVEVRLAIERDVRVRVEDEAVCSWEETRPLCLGLEAVVDADVRAVALTETSNAADDLVRLVVAVEMRSLQEFLR